MKSPSNDMIVPPQQCRPIPLPVDRSGTKKQAVGWESCNKSLYSQNARQSNAPKGGTIHARRLLQRSRWKKRLHKKSRHRAPVGAELAAQTAVGCAVGDAPAVSRRYTRAPP